MAHCAALRNKKKDRLQREGQKERTDSRYREFGPYKENAATSVTQGWAVQFD